MMNTTKWNKCLDVIHRLSSRVKNEQNQSSIVDNCHPMIPLCIEKSFYQCKSDIGQGCCVEVCGNCSGPIELSNDFVKNTNINTWKKPICDPELNQQFWNPTGRYRHQFTSSKIFDNKSEYIDYIITNVLSQVVNHIPFDSLQQLSCYLPQNIEDILRNNDIDSDRLIRILVTEILQCYSINIGQLTDWYAFANSIKPFLPSTKLKDNDNEKVNDTRHKIPSKPKKLPKDDISSVRVSNNRIKSTLTTIPVSPTVKKEQSSESIAFSKVISPSTDSDIPSVNGTPSTGAIPQIMSITNSVTPMSIHAKEKFTPVATKYQSKSKPNQTIILDKSNKINHQESLPVRERSTNRSTPNESETQHHIESDSHPHFDQKSNKNSDQSSSSDCELTIQHKHKHKRTHNRHRHYNHHTTTASFDTPLSHSLSTHTSVPIKESVQKYKHKSVDASSLITDERSVHTASRRSSNLNSTNTKQLKSSDLLNDKQTHLFKLLASSDNATKHLHQTNSHSPNLFLYDTKLLSANNEQQICRLMNEAENYEHSLITHPQLPLSKDLNKSSLFSKDTRARMDTNSTSLKKKATRINHYPNMLDDFD